MVRKTLSENLFRHFPTFLVYLFLCHYCTARPTAKDDHVTMSGEPTHFQVDDKAAELEINANAMGVKINAKPASLQVVSKPGAPSIPVANPAVVVPQLPVPYLPAPFYPSPGIIGQARTVRKRHHFFDMDPGMGNWNFKKDNIPKKRTGISKKSEKASKTSEKASKNKNNSKKREWIQRLPVMTQLMPYPQITNFRVHPLVQQMAALSQGIMRQSIPSPYLQTLQPSLQQMYTFGGQRFPYMTSTKNLEQNGQAKSLVNRQVLPHPYSNQPIYTPSPNVAFLPIFNQGLPYTSPAMVPAPLAGYNGYDPIITRDFIPYLGTPGMPRIPVPATPRVIVPGGMPEGINYRGYTPLGMWQRVSKRLIIPRSPTKKTPPTTKKISVRDTEEKDLPKKDRRRRSVNISQNNKGKASVKQGQSYHGNKENVAKRQFIITRPVIPQTPQFVTYVPVVSNSQLQAPVQVASSPLAQAPTMQGMPMYVGERRNLVLNLPSKTSGTFVLNLPSNPRVPQMYPGDPFGRMVGAFYKPVVNTGVVPNQRDDIGLQRSRIVMQAPKSSSRLPLAELAGIQGQPVLQNNRHITMSYNNEEWPTQVENQLFGGSSLQGRTTIPSGHRQSSRNRHSNWFDDFERENENPEDSDYQPSSYNDESPWRVDDEGSYTERILPDGRTILKKDHVGFGPITVQAKTAESASRDQDDATDMDLDSEKRKKIARPIEQRSYLDKRLGIPKPKEKE